MIIIKASIYGTQITVDMTTSKNNTKNLYNQTIEPLTYVQTKPNETKAWFRGVLRHHDSKQIRPTQQLLGPQPCVSTYLHCVSKQRLIEHGLTSAPTQYRLYGRRFLQVKKTQPTVSNYWRRKLQRKTTPKNTKYTCIDTQNSIQIKDTQINTASALVYNNMGWLGDGSHRGQGCQAWTAVGPPPQYPLLKTTTQLWNNIPRNYMDRFSWYLAKIFKRL